MNEEYQVIETQYVRYCLYEWWIEDGRFMARYGIQDCESEQ